MLSLDIRQSLAEAIGPEHGVVEKEVNDLQPRLNEAHIHLERLAASGKLGFHDLPDRTDEAKRLMRWARQKRSAFDVLVVLGIGGSALGNTAIQQALRPFYWNLQSRIQRKGGLKLFVLDNVDPRWTAELLEILPLQKTLFNVISKSGTTAECLANYFIFRHAVEKKRGPKKLRDHFIFTTDAQKGYLREIANREKIQSFEIPVNVGGRFSVLSPVGLVSAALTGVNIRELLAGAQAMAKQCQTPSLKKNPAALFAALQYLYYQKGVRCSALMPYSQNLWGVADWYRQLWAESLGKKLDLDGKVVHVGPTPINALGVTDQHSQAQLYMEGPYDKLITFLSVQEFGRKTIIPPVDQGHYLSNHALNELLKAEEQGTRLALAKAQRPTLTLSVSDISPFTLGEIFYCFEMAVSYMGELLHINPFDQPGVELAKVYTYALMGRSGYESQRMELEKLQQQEKEQAPVA